MYIVLVILFVAIVVTVVWVAIYTVAPKQKPVVRARPNLKERYQQCLKGTDKRAALEAGRAYHQWLRQGGALTIYDEMAIANDLSAMRMEGAIPNRSEDTN